MSYWNAIPYMASFLIYLMDVEEGEKLCSHMRWVQEKNYAFLFFHYAFIYAAIPNYSTRPLGLHQEATIGS
jgi:hypothetical protein